MEPSSQDFTLSKSSSDTRPPHRLAPLVETSLVKKRKKKRKTAQDSTQSSSSADNLQDLTSVTSETENPMAQPSTSQGLMTANMLEKLKARLERREVKPLVSTDSSSSHAPAIQTASTGSTRLTEVLSSSEGPSDPMAAGESTMAWQEPEPQAMSPTESEETLKNEVNQSNQFAPHLKLHPQPDLGISQATFTKEQPSLEDSSYPDDERLQSPDNVQRESSSPLPADQHIIERDQAGPITTEQHAPKLQLPKFYKNKENPGDDRLAPRRSLPELQTDDSIIALRESTTGQDPVDIHSQPLNPWQMLTGNDIIEDIDAARKLDGTGGTQRYHDLSRPRQRTNEANIFTERRDGRGFVRKSDADRTVETGGGFSSVTSQITGTQYALLLYKFTHHFAIAMHGIIAGISLWESVMVNHVGRTFGHLQILKNFHQFTLPLHAIHYFCLSVVLLSIIERFDLGHCSRFFLKSFLRNLSQFMLLIGYGKKMDFMMLQKLLPLGRKPGSQGLILVAVLVLISLTTSLVLGAYEERISLFPSRPSLWSDLLTSVNRSTAIGLNGLTFSVDHYPSHQSAQVVYIPSRTPASTTIIDTYMGLLLVRACCCLLSWLLVVFIPQYDRLQDEIAPDGIGRSRRISRTSFSLPPTKNFNTLQRTDGIVPV